MQARAAETLEQHIMDVNIPKSDAEWWAKRHIEALRTELAVERAAPAIDWEAKFKKAVADLEKADREIAALKNGIEGWKAAGRDLQADAQKWRDSLKRSRDRKEAKKNAITPARDKRAKNRGGDRG